MQVAHVIADTQYSASSIQLSRHIRAQQNATAPTGVHYSVARRGSDIDGVLSALHEHHHSLPLLHHRDPIGRQRLRQHLRQCRPDITLSYQRHGSLWLHSLPGLAPHIARITETRGLSFYRHADAWIANTLSLYNRLLNMGAPRHRLFHAFNLSPHYQAIQRADLQGLRSLYQLEEDWVMMSIAPLSPGKGHEVMLDALSRLPEEIHRRRWCWMVIGDGPLKPHLQRTAKRLGLEQRIIWCPQVLDVRPFLHLADLMVHSPDAEDNFGHGLLEAWRYNIPVVLSHYTGAKEIVSHQQNGYLVPQNDSTALADALALLLCQSDLRIQLAVGGHDTLTQYFSTPSLLARYDEIFRQVARLPRRQRIASS